MLSVIYVRALAIRVYRESPAVTAVRGQAN